MFKYRRLTIEELEQLKESFIRFLAAQSITADDWEKIQLEDKERQEALIDQFSDVVIEKTLHNVKILEHRLAKRILFFEFLEEEAKLYGIEWETEPPFALDAGFELKKLADLLADNDYHYHLLTGNKPYEKDKKEEIFDVIQRGAQIPANDDLFNFVLNIITKND